MSESAGLVGKVALVTGGGRGIGEGIARSLGAAGATVVVADISADEAERVAQAIGDAGGQARAVELDVTSVPGIESVTESVLTELGRLDIAANSAGVLGIDPVEQIEPADWDRVMDVNAKGVFFCCRAQIAAMRAAGNGGTIVNIASLAGKYGIPRQSHYTASKFAVVGLTNALAKEVATEAITVNSICPGIVATRMWLGEGGTADTRRHPGESKQQSWERHQREMLPQGVAQTPEDIGSTVVFLAQSPHITGQALAVDGGASL
ncbi:MAG: SDR family NAD(P)-dependent oxidoreductase [Beutenbergiaceae bacterium]